MAVANRSVPSYAAQGREVQGYGSMSSERISGYVSTGYLPPKVVRVLRERARGGNVDMVIFSYATPIAWRDNGVWVRPLVSYSATTGKHQSYLWALDIQGVPADVSLGEYGRVIAGKMIFSGNKTVPGPNYVAGE